MKPRPKPKPKRRRGRPSRSDASAKALSGVDLTKLDPKQVLAEIAADSSAPAMARFQAARTLLSLTEGKPEKPAEHDATTELALRILRGER
jgi:hypothetical protein